MTHEALGVLAFVVAASLSGGVGAQAPTDAPQRPEFRAGSITIPLDVRVVDKDGNPVTDLKQNGRPVAIVGIGIFCLDDERRSVGQLWSKAQLTMTPEQRAEVAKAGGASVSLTVPVRYPPVTLKVVAYDYNGDLVGSVNVNVKK